MARMDSLGVLEFGTTVNVNFQRKSHYIFKHSKQMMMVYGKNNG